MKPVWAGLSPQLHWAGRSKVGGKQLLSWEGFHLGSLISLMGSLIGLMRL